MATIAQIPPPPSPADNAIAMFQKIKTLHLVATHENHDETLDGLRRDQELIPDAQGNPRPFRTRKTLYLKEDLFYHRTDWLSHPEQDFQIYIQRKDIFLYFSQIPGKPGTGSLRIYKTPPEDFQRYRVSFQKDLCPWLFIAKGQMFDPRIPTLSIQPLRELNGRSVIPMAFKPEDDWPHTLFLAPEYDLYPLIIREHPTGWKDANIVNDITASQLTQYDGVWLPKRIVGRYHLPLYLFPKLFPDLDRNAPFRLVSEVQFETIAVNEPIDDALFNITPVPLNQVMDHRTKEYYSITPQGTREYMEWKDSYSQ